MANTRNLQVFQYDKCTFWEKKNPPERLPGTIAAQPKNPINPDRILADVPSRTATFSAAGRGVA
jgi:hypothetical protein